MFKLIIISALLFFLGYGILSFLSKHFLKDTPNNRPREKQPTEEHQKEKHFRQDVGEYVSYEEVEDEGEKK